MAITTRMAILREIKMVLGNTLNKANICANTPCGIRKLISLTFDTVDAPVELPTTAMSIRTSGRQYVPTDCIFAPIHVSRT
jgi:hypothetical protein